MGSLLSRLRMKWDHEPEMRKLLEINRAIPGSWKDSPKRDFAQRDPGTVATAVLGCRRVRCPGGATSACRDHGALPRLPPVARLPA